MTELLALSPVTDYASSWRGTRRLGPVMDAEYVRTEQHANHNDDDSRYSTDLSF
jgi:hypothetical protein